MRDQIGVLTLLLLLLVSLIVILGYYVYFAYLYFIPVVTFWFTLFSDNFPVWTWPLFIAFGICYALLSQVEDEAKAQKNEEDNLLREHQLKLARKDLDQ